MKCFEKEFSEKYLKLKSTELTLQQEETIRVEQIVSIADALNSVSKKGNDCVKYETLVLDYMDKAIEMTSKEYSPEFVTDFYKLQSELIDEVKFFLLRHHGYIQNTYVPNIIAGIILDIPIFIFLVKLPIVTALMILIKFIIIRIKKSQNKIITT